MALIISHYLIDTKKAIIIIKDMKIKINLNERDNYVFTNN